jgi:hypothetical protein
MQLMVKKIEIITQPGAEFPATSGGAILNIITNKMQKLPECNLYQQYKFYEL